MGLFGLFQSPESQDFLGKLGGLGNDLYMQDLAISNPDSFAALSKAQSEKSDQRIRAEDLQYRQKERQRQIEARDRFKTTLGSIYKTGGFNGDADARGRILSQAQSPEEFAQLGKVLGTLNPERDIRSVGGTLVEVGADGSVTPVYTAPRQGTDAPSAVREYQYFQGLDEEERREFLKVKRSQEILNLGGSYGVVDPTTNTIGTEFDKTLPLEARPETRREQASATEVGKEQGVARAKLESMSANVPKLNKVVEDLRELANAATYTKGGQLYDTVMREAGMEPSEGAVARAKFIAKVNNETLPLLRETFGAAFTVQEGESLKGTLGDPNLSPLEKHAALDAFIEAKVGEVGSLERRVGPMEASQNAIVKREGEIGANKHQKRRVFNPATGRLE